KPPRVTTIPPTQSAAATLTHAGHQARAASLGTSNWVNRDRRLFRFSHDDVFAGLVGRQAEKQVRYEDQIADLRAQIERINQLDQERVEQQVKAVVPRQATVEQVTPGSSNELSVQTGNGLPASGTLDPPPLLAPTGKPSSPNVAAPEDKEAKQVAIGHKKAHRHNRKHARVFRKRTQKRPTIAAGGPSVYAGPAGQRDYRDY